MFLVASFEKVFSFSQSPTEWHEVLITHEDAIYDSDCGGEQSRTPGECIVRVTVSFPVISTLLRRHTNVVWNNNCMDLCFSPVMSLGTTLVPSDRSWRCVL